MRDGALDWLEGVALDLFFLSFFTHTPGRTVILGLIALGDGGQMGEDSDLDVIILRLRDGPGVEEEEERTRGGGV